MLKYICLVTSFLSAAAFANCSVGGVDVFDKPNIFQNAISKSESCIEAKTLAESCAY